MHNNIPTTKKEEEKMICPKCGSSNTVKFGIRRFSDGLRQRYYCKDCAHVFYKRMEVVED